MAVQKDIYTQKAAGNGKKAVLESKDMPYKVL